MATGNKKSNRWELILNLDEKNPVNANIEASKAFLQGLLTTLTNFSKFKYCFSIVHDKDILESGELKRIHTHSFIELHEKETKSNLLNEITELLKQPKNTISLMETNSDYLVIQYLTHKNDQTKHQYNYTDIIASDLETLNTRYNQIYVAPIDKQQEIQQDVFTFKTLSELAQKHGLDVAKKYQSVFKQIKLEQNSDIEHIVRMLKDKQFTIDALYLQFTNLFTILETKLTNEQLQEIAKYKDLIFKIFNEDLPF